ncbi:hypothetical protein PR001_g6226, partial [Phytophthora rubi]
PEVVPRSVDHKVFSHSRSGANFPGRRANVLEQLPQTVDGATLVRVKIFTALDDSLAPRHLPLRPAGALPQPDGEREARAHQHPALLRRDPDRQFSNPRRLASQMELFSRVRGTEGVSDKLIYFGPDENIIPEDITWMMNRAAYRDYPIPRAFIGSRPDHGFNYKVYGVTTRSEGATVADVVLRSQNIDHEAAVLHHEYGNNKHLDGICDGTGVVEDPHGLDCRSGCVWRTTRYRCRASTGPRSRILVSSTISDTQEGIRARNSMRVKTDGKPSSGLIVEVANLFITPEARQLLSNNAGVVIVKESSANKCGVLCSSYEIVASMLLETDEFLSVKDELVVEIVDKLHVWARVEAQLLFRKYKKDPTSALPPASERISRAITLVHDAVHAHFDDVREADKQILFTLIEEHLPPKLRKLALDRVQQNVHLANLCSIVALSLVSKIEGLQFTEALSDSNLGNIALQDLKQEKKALRLVQEVRPWQLANKDDIADLLARGCVRAGMDTPNKIVP